MKLTSQITNFFDWNLPISRKEALVAMCVACAPLVMATSISIFLLSNGSDPIPDPEEYVLPWYMYLAVLISVPIGWMIGFRRAKAIKLHRYWIYLWMVVWAAGIFKMSGYLGAIFDIGLGLYIWLAPNKVTFAKSH